MSSRDLIRPIHSIASPSKSPPRRVASRRARWSSSRRTHGGEEARDRRRRGESHDVETRETSRCAARLVGGLRIFQSSVHQPDPRGGELSEGFNAIQLLHAGGAF